MRGQIRWSASVAALAALGFAGGCSSSKAIAEKGETPVSLTELSAPARATVERVTAGGHVDKITRETERGKQVYDVEATIGGKHQEFMIADADGAVLGTEVPIEFAQLPAPVRDAAAKYFGTTTGLSAMKGVEYGETSYEVEGTKGGKKVEVTFDPNGKEVK